MSLSVVILTFNSSKTIGATIRSAAAVSDDIHVVDSHSEDDTREIARSLGARVTEHPFEDYGRQRNWAMENLPLAHPWELHLDADERLSEALRDEVLAKCEAGFPAGVDGYFIPRLVHFMGQPLRHGGMYPIWHMRLFRRGKGRCELRHYDQHFLVEGETARLSAPMIDDIRMSLTDWTARHNRWADAELREILSDGDDRKLIAARRGGTPIERQRARRALYQRAPLFLRAFLLFLYRYVLRLGFLDGRAGLIFYVLQTFWFRFLIDAKLHEARTGSKPDP